MSSFYFEINSLVTEFCSFKKGCKIFLSVDQVAAFFIFSFLVFFTMFVSSGEVLTKMRDDGEETGNEKLLRRIAICTVTLESVEDRDTCLFPKMIALPWKSHGFAHFPQIQPTCFLRARLGE